MTYFPYSSSLKLSLLLSFSHVSVNPITFPRELSRCLNESNLLDMLLMFKCSKEK
jgi:hypothetical protein